MPEFDSSAAEIQHGFFFNFFNFFDLFDFFDYYLFHFCYWWFFSRCGWGSTSCQDHRNDDQNCKNHSYLGIFFSSKIILSG